MKLRANSQQQHMRALQKMERDSRMAERLGLTQQAVESVGPDGTIVVEGHTMLNLGSCSYLALNVRDELIEAAVEGVRNFGVSYSSSRTYSSLALYRELESLLAEITGSPVIATGSTTLGHLALLPALVEPDDTIAIDTQAHASLHLAVSVLAARGVDVHTLAHGDIDSLGGLCDGASGYVWYVADTVYSMFGDIGPVDAVWERLDLHPNLRAYLDDAHGFGWSGRHGRGIALGSRDHHPRLMVAGSLSKTFGAGGGLLVVPDDDTRARLLRTAGTLNFTGPIQTAELAAGVAAAKILLSPEHARLQSKLEELFDTVLTHSDRLGIRLASAARTPVWFAEIGPFEAAAEVATGLRAAGFFVNLSAFPVVPYGRAGIRFATTLHHRPGQIVEFLECLADLTAGTTTRVTVDLTEANAAAGR